MKLIVIKNIVISIINLKNINTEKKLKFTFNFFRLLICKLAHIINVTEIHEN